MSTLLLIYIISSVVLDPTTDRRHYAFIRARIVGSTTIATTAIQSMNQVQTQQAGINNNAILPTSRLTLSTSTAYEGKPVTTVTNDGKLLIITSDDGTDENDMDTNAKETGDDDKQEVQDEQEALSSSSWSEEEYEDDLVDNDDDLMEIVQRIAG
jgi:hypothetical protein